jgi:hypothetical protein
MEQACPGCGFISDRPSRYCRQCGRQLFAENEVTSAETRNYDPKRAQAANASYASQPHHGAWGNEMKEVQETARFYTPPPASTYDIPGKGKSNAGWWIMIAVLCLLLVGGGMVALVVQAIRPRQPAVTAAEDTIREIERMSRELEKELDVKTLIAPPPQPPPSPDAPKADIPVTFDKYKYPNAQVDRSVSGIMGGIIKMSTTDAVDVVRDFYERVTGAPPLTESRDNEKEKVIFQSSNSPRILVIISSDDELPDKTQIVLLQPVLIPKMKGFQD